MKVYIYRKNATGQYLIVAGEPWPDGRIVKITETLWGARRVARREAKKNYSEKRTLIEVYE